MLFEIFIGILLLTESKRLSCVLFIGSVSVDMEVKELATKLRVFRVFPLRQRPRCSKHRYENRSEYEVPCRVIFSILYEF